MSFDPDKFFDREHEQNLFEELLKFAPSAPRIMAVQDGGGWGKSFLLKKLHNYCTLEDIPVCLVALDDLKYNDMQALVFDVVEQLAQAPNIEMRGLASYNAMQTVRDGPPSPTALRQFLVKHFSESELNDLCFDLDIDNEDIPGEGKAEKARELVLYVRRHERTPELVSRCRRLRPNTDWQIDANGELPEAQTRDFSDTQINQAGQQLVDPLAALINDITAHCQSRAAVILFDAFDAYSKNHPELTDRLFRQFLNPLFFREDRPQKLLLVVAGRSLDIFKPGHKWKKERLDAVVHQVVRLSRWEQRHIEDCIRAYGLTADEKTTTAYHTLIQDGWLTLADVVQNLQTKYSVRKVS